jgi:hypothetical protein
MLQRALAFTLTLITPGIWFFPETARLRFTHGIAAKLVNVYLKSVFVCGGRHDHPRVRALHPPIDSLLLDALYP